jgi:uncharacterized protein
MLQSALMIIGICRILLHLPGCASLKEKRSRIKPLLARLHREFNVAAAEIGLQDMWQSAEVAVVNVSNESAHVQAQLEAIPGWLERHFPTVMVEGHQIEQR